MRRFALSASLAVSVAMLAACASGPEKTAGSSAEPSKPRVTVETSGDRVVAAAQDAALAPAPTPAVVRSPAPVGSGPEGVTGDYAGYAALSRLMDKLEREHGFDPDYLARLFSRVERQQWILDFMNRPKRARPTGPTGAWTRYRAKFITDSNIAGGGDFWTRHEAELERAHARYGVPPEYVVAIIGVETRYGGYTGKHRVIDALATLAFDYPRRSEFFTGELESFVVMSRDEGFDPFAPKGSYAGAMGLGQFMPSSFQSYFVDFDGDGRRDLWDPVDAIGSVANYFAAHGWRPGEPVAVPARAQDARAHAMKTGYDTRYSLAQLQAGGIAAAAAPDGEPVSLVRLDATGGYQYWLGLHNFYVITRYNHSSYYAMAVHQLAQAVLERHGPAKRRLLSQTEETAGAPAL